jgi:anti-sigma factor ChrR (cupin superfamily)
MNPDRRLSEECEECAEEAALYSLGALPLQLARAVEQRLESGCSYCLAQVELFAAVSEHLALSSKPVQPRVELRQRLLDRLPAPDAVVHLPAAEKTVVRGADSPWVKMPLLGVELRQLIGERTLLVRMQPGAVFPAHDHPQAEQCYVLDGSITDSDGLTLHAGDFVVMSRGSKHRPIRTSDGCTLFIAYAD